MTYNELSYLLYIIIKHHQYHFSHNFINLDCNIFYYNK